MGSRGTRDDELKRAAANWAVSQLKDGMVVGLGSRSTAAFAVAAIGQLVKEGLRIIGIPTSENTFQQANSLGIPLSTLASHPDVDVIIDGADEVEWSSLSLIKGGGGNLLREKIVATSSHRLMIIVDPSARSAFYGNLKALLDGATLAERQQKSASAVLFPNRQDRGT